MNYAKLVLDTRNATKNVCEGREKIFKAYRLTWSECEPMAKTENQDRISGMDIFWFGFAAVAGFSGYVFTPYLFGAEWPNPVSFFPLVEQAVEKQVSYTSLELATIGVLIGWMSPKLWIVKCLATMSLLPVVTMIEMPFHPTSHNLLPFELFFYGVQAIPAVVGGLTARGISRLVTQSRRDAAPDKN